MLEEVDKNVDRRGLKLVLANPGSEMMRKLDKSKFEDRIGKEWIYLTVGEAVNATNFMFHKYKNKAVEANTKNILQ